MKNSEKYYSIKSKKVNQKSIVKKKMREANNPKLLSELFYLFAYI